MQHEIASLFNRWKGERTTWEYWKLFEQETIEKIKDTFQFDLFEIRTRTFKTVAVNSKLNLKFLQCEYNCIFY